jgi:hypothetical protein
MATTINAILYMHGRSNTIGDELMMILANGLSHSKFLSEFWHLHVRVFGAEFLLQVMLFLPLKNTNKLY